MKKLLFIMFLISGVAACAQTNFPDLLEVTVNTSADQVALYRSGAGVRITVDNMFEPSDDSIIDHGTRITALEAGGVVSYWTKSGLDLSPLTSGDNILLRNSSEVLAFGDGDTYLQETVDDILSWYIGGAIRWGLSTTNFNVYVPITPSDNRTIDVGGASDFFKDLYTNRVYIGNLTAHIDTSGTDMELTDGSGTYTLTELAAGNTYSAGNGLTLTSTTFSLGDALSANVVFTGPSYDFEFGQSGTRIQEFKVDATTNVYLNSQSGIVMSHNSNGKYISLTASNMTVADGDDSEGLKYAADYSANYTNRSIVDKEYVDGAVVGGDTVSISEVAPIHSDTVPVFSFGYGTGKATDTLDCWDGAEIGAWLTGPTDSTSFVKYSGVVTAGEGTPTVTVQFFYDANLNDATPTAITAATAIVSTTSGTEITSFSNQTVPPGMWIWGEITTVSVGNKPVKLRITAHKYTRSGE